MSTNEIFRNAGGLVLRLAVDSGVDSGEPTMIGQIPAVAETTRDSGGYAQVYIPIDAVYDLSVEAVDANGNNAVAIGDPLFYDAAATVKLNKDSTNGIFYGYALEVVTGGATSTIRVGVAHGGGAGGGVAGGVALLAADGAVSIPTRDTTFMITKASAAALTLADPTAGTHDGVELTFIAATAAAHTLSNAAGSGFNAGGAGADVGTFGGAKGDNITIVAYAGDWYVKDKTNVTLA